MKSSSHLVRLSPLEEFIQKLLIDRGIGRPSKACEARERAALADFFFENSEVLS